MTRIIRMLGLMVVAVFSLSAVAASTASALQWLDNGKPIVQAAGLLVLSESIGSVELSDLSATGGATAILCTGNNHGTVGPGDHGTIKLITATGCSFEPGKNGACETGEAPNAKAVHLPWATLLLTVNGMTRNMIENSGAGEPGWVVECRFGGFFHVQDECTSKTGDPLIQNLANGDVHATFESSETAACNKGTSTSGMVVGLTLIFSDVSGLKISVSG